MKSKYFLPLLISSVSVIVSLMMVVSCSTSGEGNRSQSQSQQSSEVIKSNVEGSGQALEISFVKGKSHNHPTFAIWIEDTTGKYIQTLFITRAIGQGVFTYGDKSGNKWKPGEVRRTAALPYWSHKRGVKAEDGLYVPSPKNPVPDAYSGATPRGDFVLQTRSDKPVKGSVKVMLEINQTWDWNEFWTNDLYPSEFNYKTSCQPALVYEATINLDSPGLENELKPIGHSHYSGKDGSLDPDLSTITTALKIMEHATVKVVAK
jgi:hypothetical protein